MGYLPINPCPKCGSRQRGMWLGGEGRPWRIVCQSCGLEQWFESDERAYAEYIEHDEDGMVHFDRDGLDIQFELYEEEIMKEKVIVYAIEGAGIGGDWLGWAGIEGRGGLCSHSCSSEGWVPHDMGVTSDWKHDVYDKHCPSGWEIDYRGPITVADFNAWAVEHLPEKEQS